MRFPITILPLLVALSTVTPQPTAAAPVTQPAASPRAAALDRLLAVRESPAALDAAMVDARGVGVSEQSILEACFLYHIDRHEDAALIAMLPAMLHQRERFKLEDSAIFGVVEDWLAVIEFVQAIAALDQGDKASFKQHITEAFWLSPRQAAAFAPHIERLRLTDCMRAITLDLSAPLAPLQAGDAVTLAQLAHGKKSLLLHFWSPHSRDCEASLPDFIATASALSSNDIAVVSLLPSDSSLLVSDARAMLHPLSSPLPGSWLVDSINQPVARPLRIENLPTMVLVAPNGKILFNGEPSDDGFWQALRLIDSSIKRPSARPTSTR